MAVGDRTTTARVSPTMPLIAGHVFHVNGAPGVLTLAQAGAGVVLQVRGCSCACVRVCVCEGCSL